MTVYTYGLAALDAQHDHRRNAPNTDPLDALIREEEMTLLQRAVCDVLTSLPEERRVLLDLSLTDVQVAGRLGIRRETAWGARRDVLRRVREAYGPRD